MKTITLSDVSVNGRGYYGIGASAVPFSDDLYTYLRITDINDDGTLNMADLKSVDDEKACEYLLQPNDIVFARTGASTGRNYFYDGSDGKFVYAGFLIKFSIDPSKINPKYVKYFCLSQQYKDWIHSFNTGSTRGNINAQTLGKMPIPELEREKQNALVEILSSIDAKIKQNNAINENLEQQAQAYFQELFVDNADPEWTTGTISDLGTVVGGSTPSKAKPEYYTETGIAWITPKDLSINKSKFVFHGENDITELGLKNSSATIMPEGTVLFSSRAPIGYIAIAAGEVTTNQGFKSVVPKSEVGTPFVYFFLKNTLPVIEGMASGSTFKEVSGSTMKNVPAIIPDAETLAKFSDFCAPIFAQQRILEGQNHSLAILRDNLLPKLMSGEIDVSDIDL
ncbi:restriction endonuclease subunit S [Enterocloster lavalensis]|uniref:restriction endonuclease subunit S n=1 Tax=Enterocloster lavalensis TaxID=460384 RepID=UPI0034A3843D